MSNLKARIINLSVNSSLFAQFVALLQALDDKAPDILRVLTYHRIDFPENRPHLYPGLCIPPPDFTTQMEFLVSNYLPISVEDVIKRFSENNPEPLPPRAVLVTFDDGYKDFQENAWPVLTRLNIPASLFVPTAFPDHPERSFWWDTLYHTLSTTKKTTFSVSFGEYSLGTSHQLIATYKKIRNHLTSIPHTETLQFVDYLADILEVTPAQNEILSWDDLRKLSSEGLAIGAHTRTHPRLDQITFQDSEHEIINSLQELKDNLGSSNGFLPIYAYPGGGTTDQVVNILERLKIKAAFVTKRGINNLNKVNPLRLKRINVGQQTNIAMLHAQLLHRPSYLFSRFY